MAKLVYGVGINDADYVVRKDHSYSVWAEMLRRCYAEESLSRNPTYRGCTVASEWHLFSNFRNWYLQQGNVKGKQLDKDIMYPGNKVYSSETCIFVDRKLNSLFTKSNAIRGNYPIGVYYNKKHKKYQAQIQIQSKNTYLGLYDTVEEAEQAYINAKIQYIQDYYLSKEMNSKLVEGLNRWIDVLRNKQYDLV